MSLFLKYVQKKSKSLEKQLISLEELIVQSSNQIKVSLKNKSELILQLNLDIFQLVWYFLTIFYVNVLHILIIIVSWDVQLFEWVCGVHHLFTGSERLDNKITNACTISSNQVILLQCSSCALSLYMHDEACVIAKCYERCV